MFKQLISLLLCLALLLSAVPVPAFADDSGAADPSGYAGEPTDPSEDPSEPSEDPSEPSEDPSEPSEDPSEPSEDPSEPSEDPSEPSEDPSEPSEDPSEPSEDPSEPSEDPSEPSEDPSEPSEDPSEPSEDPSEPSEDPSEPSEDPSEPSEDPSEPSEDPSEPSEPTELVEETFSITLSDEILEYLPGNDELFAGYADQVLYDRQFSTFGSAAGARLTGDAKKLYDALVPLIRQVANGQRSSTTFVIGSSAYTPDATVTFTQTMSQTGASVSQTIDALLSDLPYEMYWFDKTNANSTINLNGSSTGLTTCVTLRLVVAKDYRSSVSDYYAANTGKTGAAAAAAANAKSIIREYADYSDYGKLVAYKNRICNLVEYDYAAAENGTFSVDIDPWQIINVFDGNTSTNVVCEGYSKAFMYLCDLSSFQGNVACYTVSGSCGGNHMWNIVTIGQNNYMADITNIDGNGDSVRLFLNAPISGSVSSGYTFRFGSSTLYYTYSADDKSIWGTGSGSILNLASSDYQDTSLAKPVVSTGNSTESGKPTLSWNPVSGATQYKVYRATSLGGSYSLINTVDTTSYTNTGASAGTTYYYKVVAVSSSSSSAASDAVACICILPRPVVSAGTNASGKPRLTWSAVSGASGYEVSRSTSQSGSYTVLGTTTAVEYNDTSAASGTKYYYKVRALHSTSAANSKYSAVVSVTAASTATLAAPSVSISNSADSGKPMLSWNVVSGATQYKVYRSTSQSGTYSLISTATATSYTDSSAATGTKYYYKVVAYASTTNSADSNIVNCTCALARPVVSLSNPSDYSDESAGKPVLSWNTVSGASRYEVHRASSENGVYSILTTTASTSFTDTSAATGAHYYYKVKALHSNASASSALSAPISIVCGLKAPVLTHSNSPVTGDIELSWNAIDGATEYRLYVFDPQNNIYVPVGTYKGTNATHSSIPGTKYTFKVYARYIDDHTDTIVIIESKSSNTVECIGILPRPDVSAGTNASGKPRLTWNAIDGASGYEIYRSTSQGGTYSVLGTTSAPEYTDASAPFGPRYYYKVRALHSTSAASSAYSAVVSVTPSSTAALAAPAVTVSKTEDTGKPVLSWNAVSGAIMYNVYRSSNATGTYKLLDTVTVTGYTDNSAAACTKYYYKVVAYSSSTSSADSNIVACTCAMTCPANVAGSNLVDSGNIVISWSAVPGASGYLVHRSTTADGTYSQIAAVTSLSYTDTSAAPGTIYYYKVSATHSDPDANSGLSEAVGRSADLPRPTVTAGNSSTTGKPTLSWNAISGASKYEIYRSTSENGTYTLLGTTTDTSYTNTGAQSLTRYYYKVKALHANGRDHSALSVAVSRVSTLSRPANVTGSNLADSGNIVISWSAVSGAASYEVTRSDSASGIYISLGTTAATSYTDTTAKTGVQYYYKVRALHSNTDFNSPYSVVISHSCDLSKPVVTAGNSVTSGKPTLSWTAIDGADTYEVYRSTSANGTFSLLGSTPDTTYTNSGAQTGITYYYKVKALHTNGRDSSAYSDVVSRICALPRPTGVTGSNSAVSGKPVISWNAVAGASKYEILRSNSIDGPFTSLSITTTTTYTNTGTVVGNTYYYVVRALHSNSAANSANSAVITRSCDLPRPTGITGGNVEETGLPTLSWTAVSGAGSYEVYRSDSQNGTYSSIGKVTVNNFTDTDTEVGIQYFYRVQALHDNGRDHSALSIAVSRTCDLPRPTGVVGGNSEVSGKPTITWNAVPGATGYEVFRSDSASGTYVSMGTTADTTYTNTGAVFGNQYYYAVRALHTNSDANSARSQVISRSCNLPSPAGLSSGNSAETGKLTLKWTAVSGARAYEIYRADGADEPYDCIATVSSTSYTDTGSVAGQQYYYKVKALHANNRDHSALSAAVYRTCDLPRPVVSTGNSPDTGKPKLTWEAIPGAISYRVYRSTSANGTFTLINNTTETTYVNTGAEVAQTYYYKIIAVHSNSVANSAYSVVKSRCCDLPRPKINISTSATSGKPTLTWKKIDGAVAYQVYRSTSANGTFSLLGTTSANLYTNTGAVAGKTYYYKVMAIHSNTSANSDYSVAKGITSK